MLSNQFEIIVEDVYHLPFNPADFYFFLGKNYFYSISVILYGLCWSDTAATVTTQMLIWGHFKTLILESNSIV